MALRYAGFEKKSKKKTAVDVCYAAGVLGALRDCKFGQLSRQKQVHSSPDLPTGDGVLLVGVPH